MANLKTPAMTAAAQLLYLKKERSSHGKRLVDAFHNVKAKFYKACPFMDSLTFVECAHPAKHRLLIERVYREYLNLKLIGE